MTTTATHAANEVPACHASLRGLNWLNFLVALMQTAFGAFFTVYLTTHDWDAGDIGIALSIGTIAAMACQVPAGLLVDWMHNKRQAVGIAIIGVGCAGLLIGLLPYLMPVFGAMALQGASSALLGPAIAAVTLALCRNDALGERFGSNVRFAAFGGIFAAAVTDIVGTYLNERAIFFFSALCAVPALVALATIRLTDLHAAHTRTRHVAAQHRTVRTRLQHRRLHVALDRRLVIFGACVALFYLGNAAVLPIATNAVTRSGNHLALQVVTAFVIVPQVLTALLSPRIGKLAQSVGRKPVLVLGFLALPVRALLFAVVDSPGGMIFCQALDGIAGAVFGVMVPLVVSDITARRGRFNLAIGIMGLAMGIGATISTSLAGWIAQTFGYAATFAFLSGSGLVALLLVLTLMPETAEDAVGMAQPAATPAE